MRLALFIIEDSGVKAKVILGVNKSDLFPGGTITPLRAETWVRREMDLSGVDVVRGQGSVRLMSAKTGEGVESMVGKLMKEMRDRDKVYVLGAANVGKSTLLNRLVARREGKGVRGAGRKKSTRNKFDSDVKR